MSAHLAVKVHCIDFDRTLSYRPDMHTHGQRFSVIIHGPPRISVWPFESLFSAAVSPVFLSELERLERLPKIALKT